MNTLTIHRNGPCMICKGADQDSDFDYCRACGFTILPLLDSDPELVGSSTLAATIRAAQMQPSLPPLMPGVS